MKLLVATLAALSMSILPSFARAIEEPAYKVVQMLDGAEVREYAPTIVAEVSVPGPADEAANQGFRLLAAYIFGANRGERKIAMTAPVTQAVEPAKIAMTAPVTQSAEAGGHVIQFTMPSAYTMETLPLPTDPRVRLREVPSTRQAVIRYSGFWTEANNREQLARLQKALQTAGLKPAGEPVYARYDPPWTPWFMRRHEIWLRLP